MKSWRLKHITEAYIKTKSFRFNNYVVTPHIVNVIGDVKNKSLLEIGCGFGRYLEIFTKQKPSKLVGCDISAHQIELCKKNFQENSIELYNLNFTLSKSSTILGHRRYDIVYSVFVVLYLETLKEIEEFLENCYKCLKDNGKIIICTLDISSATNFPQVFDILNFPVIPLKENKYDDGYPIQITITDQCIMTSYQRDFSTLKQIMAKVGFKNIKKHNIFLEDTALQAFTKDELEILKKSDILSLVEAQKQEEEEEGKR